MMSEQNLLEFLDKKVFVKVIDDKVQVGTLRKVNGDFILESKWGKTIINPEQIARITQEYNRGRQ